MKYTVVNKRHTNAGTMVAYLTESRKIWERLYGRQSECFRRYFTSFIFLKNWLLFWPADRPVYSTALFADGACVGLTFFTENQERVGPLITLKTVSIFRSGSPDIDQVWPEYVEPLLVLPAEERAGAWAFWLEAVFRFTGAHQIYQYVALKEKMQSVVSASSRLHCFIENEELGAICSLNTPFRPKSSVRRKLSQTSRKLELSPDNLKEVRDEHELSRVYENMAAWHSDKWKDTATPSGFDNPLFYKVWLSQMTEALRSSQCESRPRCFYIERNGEILGATLVLEDGPWVGFYLSGFKNFRHNHIHLGIWMHAELIERMRLEGRSVYDFMAGEAQYKAHFADRYNVHARARWVRRRHLLFFLLKLKNKIASRAKWFSFMPSN
ncbi:GNAT family N-acetyltransferase [Alteromonas sp. 14N.309.X.WAT.G.H12]|uniref:GNAT family N-acetyltransferase n=1 Tax=Alteromonas sp. 14N.309.X.WAT.G.H12 TaxID=3120824 RepID=UPI002FCFD1BA